jgi:hypothetical protein
MRVIVILMLAILASSCGDGSDDATFNSVISLVRVDELGLAFADSSINASVFREESILRISEHEYFVALYDADGQAQLIQVRDGVVSARFSVLPRISTPLLGDGHASISLGKSEDGYLHVIYGAHATIPYYARISVELLHGDSGTNVIMAMPLSQVMTYPQFFNVGSQLHLWYREDINGEIQRAIYDASGEMQEIVPERILEPGGAVSVYVNQLAVAGERMALTWMYRMPMQDGKVLNEGLYGMVSESPAGGWRAIGGGPLAPPVGRDEALRVLRIPDDRELLNQTSSAFGPDDLLYVTYYSKDDAGIYQIWLAAFDLDQGLRRTWKVSANPTRFDLVGAGTLVLPLSRPRLHVSETMVHVIYRQNDQAVVATVSRAFDSEPVSRLCYQVSQLGAWEPTSSRLHWEKDRLMHVLLQPVRQAPRDQANPGLPTKARVLVFRENLKAVRRNAGDLPCAASFATEW